MADHAELLRAFEEVRAKHRKLVDECGPAISPEEFAEITSVFQDGQMIFAAFLEEIVAGTVLRETGERLKAVAMATLLTQRSATEAFTRG